MEVQNSEEKNNDNRNDVITNINKLYNSLWSNNIVSNITS